MRIQIQLNEMVRSRAVQLIACDTHAHLVRQATRDHVHNRMRFICDIERDIAKLVSELQLCILSAAPFENRWRFTANHGAGFTDEMHMRITFD